MSRVNTCNQHPQRINIPYTGNSPRIMHEGATTNGRKKAESKVTEKRS